MQHPSHPDDQRLAALAASEPDAVADGPLVTHVAGCPRCAPMVEDLRMLRSALAELPDIPPSRPLRFLPPIPEPTTTRPVWLGVLRGITAPAMAIGVIMILVGAIGTTGIGSLGAGGAAPALTSSGAGAAQASSAPVPAIQGAGGKSSGSPSAAASQTAEGQFGRDTGPTASASEQSARTQYLPSTPSGGLLVETGTWRPPFEWLLGAGVVLLAAAFVARGYVRRRLAA